MTAFPQPGAVTLLICIAVTGLLLYFFQAIMWLVVPILLASILYYCLRPVMEALVRQGMRHETAAKAVWLLLQLATVGIVLAVALIVPARAVIWQKNFGHYLAGGENLLGTSAWSLEKIIPILGEVKLAVQLDQYIKQFTGQFAERNLLPIILQVLKWLPSLLLVPYIIYFMLTDATRLKKYLVQSVPNAAFEKALLLFSRIDASLQNYIQGLLLLTLLDGTCLALGLLALGITHAFGLGLAAAVLAWIPYLGSIIGCTMVVSIAATDYPEKIWVAYACLILFLLVRLLDDFVFLPLTIGRKLNVHPLLSVLLLLLGAEVAGATGLVLALPLFGIVAVVGETVSQIVTDQRRKARAGKPRRFASPA